jgi:hypothetical protein
MGNQFPEKFFNIRWISAIHTKINNNGTYLFVRAVI